MIPPQYDWAEPFSPEMGVALARVGPKPGAYTLYLIDTAGLREEPHGRDIQISIRAEGGWYCTVTDVWGGKTYYDQDMQPLESPDPGLPMDRLRSTPDENGLCRYYRRDIVTGTLYLYQLTIQETCAEVYDLEGNLLVTGADPYGTPTAGLFPCTQDGFLGWKDGTDAWVIEAETDSGA